ncbi:hypothetical protein LIN78_15420 [Leeia sp. TBRC 13508]|uniref:Uncharacterized protein n=1 Tax=Leeia speluncae TaxID=2884804 RepID=A0ABS8D9X9_9NEIS|nr:hypothetical protein [Leeia speluncae]MCB6184937.1 hypothetical protein [Leeia speluncae]
MNDALFSVTTPQENVFITFNQFNRAISFRIALETYLAEREKLQDVFVYLLKGMSTRVRMVKLKKHHQYYVCTSHLQNGKQLSTFVLCLEEGILENFQEDSDAQQFIEDKQKDAA